MDKWQQKQQELEKWRQEVVKVNAQSVFTKHAWIAESSSYIGYLKV